MFSVKGVLSTLIGVLGYDTLVTMTLNTSRLVCPRPCRPISLELRVDQGVVRAIIY